MRIAASNLAWSPADDATIAEVLSSTGVRGVEIAPMKIWPSAPAVSRTEAARYASWWRDRGFALVALQGVLFQRPDLLLFGDAASVQALQHHLAAMARLAGYLDARIIVLGAPSNRRRGARSHAEAIELASATLRVAARAAHAEGCILCVEPNPARYGCDFITTAAEGSELVEAVDHPGFGLHLDTGALTLSGELRAGIPAAVARHVRHFHISEVDLAPLGSGTVDHGVASVALREAGYRGWCSIEMRQIGGGEATLVRDACGIAQAQYGDAEG